MYRITLYCNAAKKWNWRLAYNDKVMCQGTEGPTGFATRTAAFDNLISVARVFRGITQADLYSAFAQLYLAEDPSKEQELGKIDGRTRVVAVYEGAGP